MAQPAGTVSSYDMSSNREDLSDLIAMISPTDTPFISACGKTKATNTKHEWQKDALEAAAANANIEGDDDTPVADTQTTRVDNYTQILKKHAVVTGTQQDGMNHAGIKNMMARKISKRMKEIKLDLELACIGPHNAKVAGNDTTARELGSLQTYITTNSDRGVGASEPTGDGSDVPGAGTNRDFTETLLTTVLQSCYDEGANPKLMMLSATNKNLVDGFDAGGTHYVDKDDKELINAVDVYVGGLGHTLKAVPSRHIFSEDVLLIDPEYVKLADMRPIHSYDLAKTGDSHRKSIVWETTLEVCNEAAHAIIGDTNG
ncbi:MAG: DUF5309 domain-containing protein [Candidatus Thiodiazotropha sp.]